MPDPLNIEDVMEICPHGKLELECMVCLPICPGCSEANGTEGYVPVRHAPPLCGTNAERKDATE